jgi:hypothetical protein
MAHLAAGASDVDQAWTRDETSAAGPKTATL